MRLLKGGANCQQHDCTKSPSSPSALVKERQGPQMTQIYSDGNERNMNMCEGSKVIGPQSLCLQDSARCARVTSLSGHIGWKGSQMQAISKHISTPAGLLHCFHPSLGAVISVPGIQCHAMHAQWSHHVQKVEVFRLFRAAAAECLWTAAALGLGRLLDTGWYERLGANTPECFVNLCAQVAFEHI